MKTIQLKDKKKYNFIIDNSVFDQFQDVTGLNPFSDIEFHSPKLATTLLWLGLKRAGTDMTRGEVSDKMGIETNFEVSIMAQEVLMEGLEYLKDKMGKPTEEEEKK